MRVKVVGSRNADSGSAESVGIERLPRVSPYAYASAWPRVFEVEPFTLRANLEEAHVKAAAAILKVSAWSNGFFSSRTWDEVSIPVALPEAPVFTPSDTSVNGFESTAIYNCASLAHFAVGVETLQTLDSPIGWSFAPTDLDALGILRLVPKSEDPVTTPIGDGHWMIGVGTGADIVPNSADAQTQLGLDEPVVLHVNGGNGPLLLTRAGEVSELYARQYHTDMAAYLATPIL